MQVWIIVSFIIVVWPAFTCATMFLVESAHIGVHMKGDYGSPVTLHYDEVHAIGKREL